MKPNILMPIMIFMTRYYHNSKHICRLKSVPHKFFKFYALALLVLAGFFIDSCEKGPTTIGNKLLPGSDFVDIKSIDTLSVFSYTVFDDSTRTDNPATSFLGKVYDPYFGTTTTSFVSQIRLASKWDGLPFVLDSVKMYLGLSNVKKGVPDAVHTLKLSEISDQIYSDQAYYSTTPVELTGFEVSDLEIPALKADTINTIHFNLPNSFGEYILRDTAMLFYSNTKPDFRSYFKGLLFQMDPGPAPLFLTLSVAPPSTAGYYNNTIELFGHNPLDTTGTLKDYFFILDATNKNAAFNIYNHDFSTALAGKKINHINDGVRDTLTYQQSFNGVYTRMLLPGLEALKNDPAFKGNAINKARLTIPVFFDGNQFTPSKVPSILFLRYTTKSGPKSIVPDYTLSAAFYDGKLDSVNMVYNFNIPTFVQKYLNDATGDIKPELEITQGTSTTNVILKANKSKTPVKFEFTYTKF
jgi:hypothetical protein